MSQRPHLFPPGVLRLRHQSRLTHLALAFLTGGFLLAIVELVATGRLTTPALGLTVIGVVLLPVGVMPRLIAAPALPGAEWPGEEEDGGGGGGGRGPQVDPPLPPGGGLEVDWAQFEREFAAYAQSVTTPTGVA